MDRKDRKEISSLRKQIQDIENDRSEQLGKLKKYISENASSGLNEPVLVKALNKRFDDMAKNLKNDLSQILRRGSTTEAKTGVAVMENDDKRDNDPVDRFQDEDGMNVDDSDSPAGSEDDEPSCSSDKNRLHIVNQLKKKRRIEM